MSERFAFKIDKALKLNLYKICRLCGIDNPDKVPILNGDRSVVDVDGEPELWQKIQNLIGFKVSKDDKMPQTMCTLCVEKINDFYEFREMCYATNVQTRKLLGLKNEEPKKFSLDIKTELEVKEVKEELNVVGKRGRKRKSDETNTSRLDIKDCGDVANVPNTNSAAMRKKMRLAASLSKKDAKLMPKEEIKDEPLESLPVNSVEGSKLKQVCNICSQRFSTKGKLERHKAAQHLPLVLRYFCSACNETLRKGVDIKNHQLWHKLSKTPYTCPYCSESLLSIYSYSRHMRDHYYEPPATILVLDRVCPQCRETFATNFLYNTHACAIRTRKCAGCNRQLRNETEYVRHAAICGKVYLNYSKHIPVADVPESCVRIKNENDVEAAAAAETIARIAGIPLDMTPVVSLTRLPSPVVMAANQCVVIPAQSLSDSAGNEMATTSSGKVTKRGVKKGVSRKDLKRVDELLKSTLDALVSIKHEPEVHVETEALTVGESECPNEDEEAFGALDDFHHDDENDDSEHVDMIAGAVEQNDRTPVPLTMPVIKLEVVEESYRDPFSTVENVTVKTEVMDIDGGEGAAKMPVLKIKIKKEHGTLNSSLVDEVSARSEKKKKKKKRKEAERNKEKLDNNQNSEERVNVDVNTTLANVTHDDLNMSPPGLIHIKQEPLEHDTTDTASGTQGSQIDPQSLQPEATVMTSIPKMQFQIACISSGVEFAEEAIVEEVPYAQTSCVEMQEVEQDVKPNLVELNRMLKISSVSSGIDMTAIEADMVREEDEDEAEQTAKSAENVKYANTGRSHVKRSTAKNLKRSTNEPSAARLSTGKALKSTGGVARTARKSTNDMPHIVAVHGGSGLDFNEVPPALALAGVCIKAEPRDRGYADELPAGNRSQLNDFSMHDLKEQQYIDSIDYSNVKIKEEPDIEVSEVQLSHTEILTNTSSNGIANTKDVCKKASKELRRKSEESTVNDSGSEEQEPELEADGESLSDSEESGEEEEEEIREYREIEMPPLLLLSDDDAKQKEAHNENMRVELVEVCTNHESIARADEAAYSANTPCFLITNVCSQATEVLTTTSECHSPSSHKAESEQSESGLLQIADVSANSVDLFVGIAADKSTGMNEARKDVSVNCFDLSVGIATDKSSRATEAQADTIESSAGNDCFAVEGATLSLSGAVDTAEKELLKAEVSSEGTVQTSIPTDDEFEIAAVGADLSISGAVNAAKEVPVEAQPFYEARAQAAPTRAASNSAPVLGGIQEDTTENVTEDYIDEEQQNVLNQQVLEHASGAADSVIATIELQQFHPYLEDITSSSEGGLSGSSVVVPTASTSVAAAALAMVNKEETENLINEHTDAALRQQNPVHRNANSLGNSSAPVVNPVLLDNSNINEIAENNNNANIERELQDDNVGALLAELRLPHYEQ